MQEAAKSLTVVNVGLDCDVDENAKALKRETFAKSMAVVEEKAHHKDWQVKEVALVAMLECFESATEVDIAANEKFVTECTILLKDSLETNNMQVYMAAL